MMDALHDAGIEIVSPTFMNTRRLSPETPIIPEASPADSGPADVTSLESGAASPESGAASPESGAASPEEIVFQKAEQAASLETIRQTLQGVHMRIADLHKGLKAMEESDRAVAEQQIERLRGVADRLEDAVAQREADINGEE